MTQEPTGLRRNLTRYGDEAFALFLRTVFLKSMGHGDDALERPIVGVVDTGSAYNSCHGTVPALVDAIERGVLKAGGLPFRFPVISLHESFAAPTSMYLRNLMAMDAEEMIRAQPMDAVVLIGGCDKTVPALLMGAASAGVPAILEVTGPMLAGRFAGERVGACTDCRRFWARHRAGKMDAEAIAAVAGELGPTSGTCMVMGTASTMALAAEALGVMLPGGATIPAVHAERLRHAEATGLRAVGLAAEGLTPERVMTPAAFDDALRVVQAIGGSTNAVIHLTAIAGRLGIRLDLARLDALGRETPMIVDLKPTGRHYMEDLHAAGGFAAIRRALGPLLHAGRTTVAGPSGEARAREDDPASSVVAPVVAPLHAGGALAALFGTLAPGGAVIKQAAASPRLLRHAGRAVVFDGLEDMARRIDDPDLDVTPDDVLVLRGAGPVGAPGMPEAGYLPIPKKLARDGVTDMVRVSDARMSGTAFGTVILHLSPEAAAGGPLARIATGDRVTLDVPDRRLDVAFTAAKRPAWTPPPPPPARLRPPARAGSAPGRRGLRLPLPAAGRGRRGGALSRSAVRRGRADRPPARRRPARPGRAPRPAASGRGGGAPP